MTALVCVANDIPQHLVGSYVQTIGNSGHLWFQSHLSDRSQAVQTDGCVSESTSLLCGVPQGPALGPLVFSIHSEPICDIARKHHINIHSHAVVYAIWCV